MLLNKVVWVTGASGFLGNAVASALQTKGAKVIAQGHTRPACSAFLAIRGDCRNEKEMSDLATRISTNGIDVLICCAGGVLKETNDSKTMLDAMNKNLISAVNVIKAAIPYMKNGHIILVGSDIVNKPRKNELISYTVAKAALHQYAICLANDLNGIKVNCVSPGTISKEPKPGLATVNDFVRVILDTLESDKTGQIIPVFPQ